MKNAMKSLRTKFILPDNHKILITPYCFLGFIAGDGSLSVSNLKSFPLKFNIVQSITEKIVLEAIKLFLLELPLKFTKKQKLTVILIKYQQKKTLSFLKIENYC